MEMLEEAVQVVDRMLTERPASSPGSTTRSRAPTTTPGRCSILGRRSSSEAAANGHLRLVARHADMCNVSGVPTRSSASSGPGRTLPGGRTTLRRHHPLQPRVHPHREGRDRARRQGAAAPDFGGVAGTPETVVARLREYAAVGSQYVTFTVADPDDVEAVRLIGETVVPAVADL